MFRSVIEQKGWRSGRLGTGAGVSVLLHAGIFAAVFFVSADTALKPRDKEPLVVGFLPFAQPHGGNPNPAKAIPVPQPKLLVQLTVIPPTPPPEPDPPPTPEDELPGIPGGPSDVVVCNLPPVFTDPKQAIVVPFSQRMKPPELISGAPIQYTREALEARIQGMLIAKCVITHEGKVEDCKLLKGMPHMDAAVLSALETRRYTPVTWQGKPISVSYLFKIKLEPPR